MLDREHVSDSSLRPVTFGFSKVPEGATITDRVLKVESKPDKKVAAIDPDIKPLYEYMPEGLTQAELAEKVGLGRTSINYLMRGKYVVSKKMAYNLAAILGLSVEDVIESSKKTVQMAQAGEIKNCFTVQVNSRVSFSEIEKQIMITTVPCQTLAELFMSSKMCAATISKKSGVWNSILSNLRRGKRGITLNHADQISKALGCQPVDVLRAANYTRMLASGGLLGWDGFPMGIDEFRCDPRAKIDREWKPGFGARSL